MNGTELVRTQTTSLTMHQALEHQIQELMLQPVSITTRSTCLEATVVSATLAYHSQISSLSILRLTLGRNYHTITLLQKEEEATVSLSAMKKYTFMVVGIKRCNTTISFSSTSIQRNGLIQISTMTSQDGTTALSLLRLFQHGSSSSLVVKRLSTTKVQQELLDNTLIPAPTWTLEP